VLAIRHDERRERPGEFDVGRGTVAFVDGHADFIDRGDTFTERFFDPAVR
jgi:prepilin-type processing-associated H-X9-DG protein